MCIRDSYQGFVDTRGVIDRFHVGAISFEVLMGALTFTGSLMAFGKLQGILPGSPITFPGQNAITLGSIAACGLGVVALTFRPESIDVGTADIGFYVLAAWAFLLGVLPVSYTHLGSVPGVWWLELLMLIALITYALIVRQKQLSRPK